MSETLTPIALQLYTLREALAADAENVLRRVAAMGYVGVEPFGMPENPAKLAALIRDLGLVIPSAHLPVPTGDAKDSVLMIAEAYDLKRIVAGRGPGDFQTQDATKRSCEMFNEAAHVAAQNGLTFVVHNHWWEFQVIEGRLAFDVMLECLDPAIEFEVDVYWVQTANVDPAQIVTRLGSRAPLLHIKDGPAEQPGDSMVAVGEGAVDIPAVVRAGQGSTEWLIVELDRCATDMFEAVEKSCRYLVAKGLGRGREG
ncbi:MAG: sugar phosphate isomerase/epimerase [Anaerolineae bacterium]|nr:sugar phosphate isomerase/epimerase [Anaerolineae bacterium]